MGLLREEVKCLAVTSSKQLEGFTHFLGLHGGVLVSTFSLQREGPGSNPSWVISAWS